MRSILFLFFVLVNATAFSVKEKIYQLELVQALFRHGDRIPDKGEVYKTDPYDPKYYEPTGYGQLTKIGMHREYQIGRTLRSLYGNFIGELKYDKVYAYSTDYDRTKASLQLVLAGLFPPTLRSSWNPLLRWTPVPTHYEPFDKDILVGPMVGQCEGLEKMQQTLEKLPEVQDIHIKDKAFLDYVRNKTEIGDTRIFTIILIASNFRAIESMGLKLPSWCSEQDYAKLLDIMKIFFKSLAATPELRKQNAGPMVKQFLENMKNHKSTDKRKIYLYGGHDINVASFTRAHNFTGIPAIPDFGSTVIIEKLRRSDNKSYVRMYLWTGVSEKLIKLKLTNCDYICPLTVYEQIVAPVFPESKLTDCLSGVSNCGLQKRTSEINPEFSISHAIAGGDIFSFKYADEIYL